MDVVKIGKIMFIDTGVFVLIGIFIVWLLSARI